MIIRDAYDLIISRLHNLYKGRELENTGKALIEDLFDIKNIDIKRELDESEVKKLDQAIIKLSEGQPLSFVTGVAYFYGYKYFVNQNVLIPRPETEELVYWIERDINKNKRQYDILDIGTGSGCIPISLKKKLPFVRVFGVEKSLDALNVARINSRRLDVLLELFRIDFLDNAYWHLLGKFDIIVSNPPYIPRHESDKMDKSTVKYEPQIALFVEDVDPFIFYRKIIEFAKSHLKDDGCVYVEINEYRDQELMQLFLKHFERVTLKNDLQNKPRMIKASKLR